MESIKGSKDFEGYMSIKHSIGTMLETELPKMIYRLSINNIGVESNNPLEHSDVVLMAGTTRYKQLTTYFNLFQFSRDSYELDTKSNSNPYIRKFLVNTEGNLGNIITTDRITTYNNALLGKTIELHSTRQLFFECVSSLCCVTCTTSTNNKLIYTGSCAHFWKTRYCKHAAVFQYKEELETFGVAIASKKAHKPSQTNQTTNNVVPELKKQYNKIAIAVDSIRTKLYPSIMNKHLQIYELLNEIPSVPVLRAKLDKIQKWTAVDKVQYSNFAERLSLNMLDELEHKSWIDGCPSETRIKKMVKDTSNLITNLNNM